MPHNLNRAMPAQLSESRTTFPPLIVRDWFIKALNPLIYGLRMEVRLLSRGDLSWRFAQSTIVSLVPLKVRLSQNGQDLWDQFVSQVSEFRDMADIHDKVAHELELSCWLLASSLVESVVLRDIFAGAVSADGLTEAEVKQTFGAISADGYLPLLAEYLINDLGELPDYYSTSQFWNRRQVEFRKTAADPAIELRWVNVRDDAKRLQSAADKLLSRLLQARSELSMNAGVSFGDESWRPTRFPFVGHWPIPYLVRRSLPGSGEGRSQQAGRDVS